MDDLDIRDDIQTDASLLRELGLDIESTITLDKNGYDILDLDNATGNVVLTIDSVTNIYQGSYGLSVTGNGSKTFVFAADLQDKVSGVIDYTQRNNIQINWNYALDPEDLSISNRIESITITHTDKFSPFTLIAWSDVTRYIEEGENDLKCVSGSGAFALNATKMTKAVGSGVEFFYEDFTSSSSYIYLAGTNVAQLFPNAGNETDTLAIYSSNGAQPNTRIDGVVGAYSAVDLTVGAWFRMQLIDDGAGYFNVEFSYSFDRDTYVVFHTAPLTILAGTDVYIHANTSLSNFYLKQASIFTL